MNNHDLYIMALVKAVFEDYPCDGEKAKKSFEIIKSQTKLKAGDEHG